MLMDSMVNLYLSSQNILKVIKPLLIMNPVFFGGVIVGIIVIIFVFAGLIDESVINESVINESVIDESVIDESVIDESVIQNDFNHFLIPAQKYQFNPTLNYDAKYPFGNSSLFQGFGIEGIHYISNNDLQGWKVIDIFPRPELIDLYDELGVTTDPQKSIVIYPLFTASAYLPNGFYDYYKSKCDESCLTVRIQEVLISESSGIGVQVLKLLGYDVITDLDVAKNPSIINQFDKVILLHNEYVTKEMFDSITNHPKVLYLYPNALYAEISFNELDNEITLIRGHGYPDSSIDNGFDWEFDNTRPYEYDTECNDWKFHEIDNGVMLNCYPDLVIHSDKELLKFIKEY